MSLLKDIINLSEKLPEKDKLYFDKFIQERKFEDALNLINSIIFLSEKAEDRNNDYSFINLDKKNHNYNYLNLDKESILLLQNYLVKYLDQLNIEYESNLNMND